MADQTAIPSPRTLPFIGNLHQIPKAGLIQHLMAVARDFADPGIFKLYFGSYVSIWVSHPELVAELCDEARFRKIPGPGLRAVRAFAGDGLFTAFSDEENWGRAHRILLPAFSQRAMRGYYDMMLEVADALVGKWVSLAGHDVHVADDMTRFTLDSIAIAGFGYRFNSFGNQTLDPFLQSLATALIECMNKTTRLPIQQRFAKRSEARLAAAIATMNGLVDRVIAERRTNPTDGNDLLNLMLEASDPDTGAALSDLNIRYQILTFLIAGHETTSGMLSFAFYQLLRNPHVLAQAYAEVDRVLPGDSRPDYADIAKLDVIERILKETLRLWPTAPAFSVGPFEADTIGGAWSLRKDRPVNVMTPALHRHPAAWDRPDDFDIDRWLPEAEARRHPHAYKPFGNGVRACIGRQFAMVEAKLAMAMLLQRFAISDRHDYALSIKETLSIKPDDFLMRVDERAPHTRATPVLAGQPAEPQADFATLRAVGAGRRLSVIWGSSLGTARDIAEEIAQKAEADGFEVRVRSMDEALGTIPDERVVIAVTATYNGKAPDSAVKAEAALDAAAFADANWATTQFAVLGIGSSNWPNYQAFPRRIDAAFEAAKATRLIPRGEADTEGDFDGQVGTFLGQLWAALGTAAEDTKAPGLSLTIVDNRDIRASVLPDQAVPMTIAGNCELVSAVPDGTLTVGKAPRSSTRLIAVDLPESTTYSTGDHIAIYARNAAEHVDLAIDRLGVAGEAQIVLGGTSGRFRHLPLGRTVTVRQLLTDFVELQEPMPRRALEAGKRVTHCPHTQRALATMDDDWTTTAQTRLSLLGLLVKFPAIEMGLESFVELSSAVAPRFYSIASSPLVNPHAADLIVGTTRAPAWSGIGEHQGFASTHMRDLKSGDAVFGYVRSPNPPFVPPSDPATPTILVGPGTGFAPFRGFIQQRAAERAGGHATGPIHLFFGCKHPDHDWLCGDEMRGWEADGLITLHRAFSAVPDFPHAYVQDAMAAAADTIWPLLESVAQVFVCGDGRNMAPAVRDTLIAICAAKRGIDHDAASQWLEQMIEDGRYHQDVYGFGK